jgi:hypothetical protein
MTPRRVLFTTAGLALFCALPLTPLTPSAAGQTIPLRPTPTADAGSFSVLVQPTPPVAPTRPVATTTPPPAGSPAHPVAPSPASPSPSPLTTVVPQPSAAAGTPLPTAEPFRVEHAALAADVVPQPPAGWRLAETALRVFGTPPSGSSGTVRVALSARDLAAAGGRPGGLALFRLDPGAWTRVPGQTADQAPQALTFVPSGPGTFAVLAASALPAQGDYAVSGGRFFSRGADGGFTVLDGLGGPPAAFWTVYTAIGGEPVLGRPVSRRFSAGGRLVQVFERGIISSASGGAATARTGESGPPVPDAARLPEPPPLPSALPA